MRPPLRVGSAHQLGAVVPISVDLLRRYAHQLAMQPSMPPSFTDLLKDEERVARVEFDTRLGLAKIPNPKHKADGVDDHEPRVRDNFGAFFR